MNTQQQTPKDGKWNKTYGNGYTVESTYVNGKKHGIEKYWYPNGKLAYELSYAHGKLHGSLTEWYMDGSLKCICTYEHGRPTSTTTYI